MSLFTFGPFVAYDPTTGTLVTSGSGQVYAITDTTFTTPLSVTDLTGSAMTEVKSSNVGIIDEFNVNLADDAGEVNWKSGDWVIRLNSFKGVMAIAKDAKTVALAAQARVEELAATILAAPAILPAGGSQGNVLYRGASERTGVWGPPSQGGGGASTWDQITNKPDTFSPSPHTHVVANITDMSTVGAAVARAQSPQAAREAIGAGTPSTPFPGFGTTSGTAAAGNHTHTAAAISFAPSGSLTATDVQSAIVQAAAMGGSSAGAGGIYVWRYTAGAWPAPPASQPAGVQLVFAIGPSQPATLPGWMGLAANQAPMIYMQAATQ